jgi:membrane fusion protein (multidrug efflux system)
MMFTNRTLIILGLCLSILAGELTYLGYHHRNAIGAHLQSLEENAIDLTSEIAGTGVGFAYKIVDIAETGIHKSWRNLTGRVQDVVAGAQENVEKSYVTLTSRVETGLGSISAIDWPSMQLPEIHMPAIKMVTFRQQHRNMKDNIDDSPLYLADFSQIEPAAGTDELLENQDDAQALEVEAVLVPQKVTVISSSRDGRIKNIFVDNGDVFHKGDVLIEYDCDDLMAEAEMVEAEKSLADKKTAGTEKLFKLDLISDLEKMDTQTKAAQLDLRIRLYQSRMDQCRITAGFDGRVTNRLANANEYTRTDRVLMEIASNEPLRAEFLIPSKWLRWVNVGAPLDIVLNETEKSYMAHITRIHGEVDPVSQSIQVVATLDGYDDPLLPGMSGQAHLNTKNINDAGVTGFLNTPQPH